MNKWDKLEDYLLELFDASTPSSELLESEDRLYLLWEDPDNWDIQYKQKQEHILLTKILGKMQDFEDEETDNEHSF